MKTAKLHILRRSLDSKDRSFRARSSNSTQNSPSKPNENPIKFLRPVKDSRNGSMDDYSGSVGNKAKLEFYETYMNLPQFSQRNKHQKLEDSPNLAYLDVVEKHKLKPISFGIVRRKGPETSIDIHQYSMGDTYAKAFSEGIRHLKDVATLNLKANRLSDSGASQILQILESKKVKRIILSENRISLKSVNELNQIIKFQESKLKVLELENTYISEKALNNLLKIVAEDKKLRRLSLAKNNIGEGSAHSLAEMLKYNQSLKYLDLHWNCLGIGAGALIFLNGLASNDGLVHIDLSYNSFGSKNNSENAQAFSKTFELNQFLQHVDLSNNYFSKKDCEIIGEGLKDNHLIFGLHMQGNDCYVDSKGYIISLDYSNKTEQGHLHRRLLDTPRYKRQQFFRLNCWICEKWVEISIKWKPKTSGPSNDSSIFIHLECENFKQSQLTFRDSDSIFETTRMVPPGLLKFFFSDSSNLMISKEYNTFLVESPIKVEYPSPDGSKNFMSISKVNAIYIESEEWDFEKIPSVKPRNDPRIKEKTEMQLVKVDWSVENSSFKDYRFDDQKLMEECCDFDLEVSNIKEIVPDPAENHEIKLILRENYKIITSAFRKLSAISGIELFSISKNVLNDFLKKSGFNDEDFFSKDVGILWNLSNAPQSKGERFNAGNGLCRYEFAEFLIRLAIDRFLKTKICASIKESFEKLLNDHAIPGMLKYDESSWHTEQYLTEDVDLFFKLHRPVLEAIFYKYASMGKGSVERMNLHEFRTMCNETGLCNDGFVMREIDMCFRQAMMTEVDEILRGEHLQMVYVEFIEALARIADQIYQDPYGKMTLRKKLEGLFLKLLEVCPAKTRNNFEHPTEATYHNMKYQKKLVTIQEFIPSKV